MVAIPPDLSACPPGILSQATVQAIITVESAGNPLAIKVNGGNVVVPPVSTAAEATAVATRLVSAGYSVDLGLMQVNSRNLGWLHESVGDMFDVCSNVASGSLIFLQFYQAALRQAKFGDDAVQAALSGYNTGNFVDGITNGYVTHYDLSGGVQAIAARSAASGTYFQTGSLGKFDTTLLLRQVAWTALPAQIIPLHQRDFTFSLKTTTVLHQKTNVSLRIALPKHGRHPTGPIAVSKKAGSIQLRPSDYKP